MKSTIEVYDKFDRFFIDGVLFFILADLIASNETENFNMRSKLCKNNIIFLSFTTLTFKVVKSDIFKIRNNHITGTFIFRKRHYIIICLDRCTLKILTFRFVFDK